MLQTNEHSRNYAAEPVQESYSGTDEEEVFYDRVAKSVNEEIAVEIVNRVFKENGELASMYSEYKVRPSQFEAAKELVKSLIHEKHSVIEGPCGFGKTYAYLIPAIIDKWIERKTAGDECLKTVIATGSISLQEQLCYKDLPQAIKVMENLRKEFFPGVAPTNFALFKGRQNFICPMKLAANADMIKDFAPDYYQQIIKVEKSTGDLSDLDTVLPNEISKMCVCYDADDCKGTKCPMYNNCPYMKQKKKASESDIIICNYHILFSALDAYILPAFNTLIWDEAHEAVEVFRNLNIETLSERWISNLAGNITKALNTRCTIDYIESLDNVGSFVKHVIDIDTKKPNPDFIKKLKDIFNEYMTHISRHCGVNLQSPYSDTKLVHELSYSERDNELRMEFNSELCYVRDLFGSIKVFAENILNDTEASIAEVEDAERCESVSKSLYESAIDKIHFLERSDIGDKDYAYYVKKTVNDDNIIIDYERMPVDVSDTIFQVFLNKERKIKNIFTSATLSTGGNMEFFKSEVGLNKCSDVFEFIGQSPFNLKEQELWYLPNPCVDGNKPDFPDYFNNTVVDIVKAAKEGILILTTSVSAMHQTYDLVRTTLAKMGKKTLLLRQNDMPRTKLLEKFKEDGHAILVATKSFFTGIDVPGQALQCLIIDKLPFATPNDPVVMHLSCKRDYNCFMDYQVPKMIITLKQAVGRGVRSVNDKCVICIADGRMATARYKGKIGRSFPYDKTATRNIEDVASFLK